MTNELQLQLKAKYPKIFVTREKAIYPYDQRGIECGDGWYSLICKMCNQIEQYIKENNLSQVECTQCKEKFGTLRFYIINTDATIELYIDFAMSLSYNICEKCGMFNADKVKHRVKNKGLEITLCDNCNVEFDKSKQRISV